VRRLYSPVSIDVGTVLVDELVHALALHNHKHKTIHQLNSAILCSEIVLQLESFSCSKETENPFLLRERERAMGAQLLALIFLPEASWSTVKPPPIPARQVRIHHVRVHHHQLDHIDL
jgi:hypothetical protein